MARALASFVTRVETTCTQSELKYAARALLFDELATLLRQNLVDPRLVD